MRTFTAWENKGCRKEENKTKRNIKWEGIEKALLKLHLIVPV